MEKPRQIAFRILQRHAQGTEFVEDVLADELSRSPLPSNDRGLAHELACGVVRCRRTLDWLIDQQTDGRPQQPIVRQLLRLGLYQLLWLDRIPAHAAVHETVELAKHLGLGPVAGFINAFLRKVTRDLPMFRTRLETLEQSDPGIRFSHPDWLCRRWDLRWGREKLVQLLKWNNQAPPLFVRLNSLRMDRGTLEGLWQKEGVRFVHREFHWVPKADVYELTEHPALTSLKSFNDGGFYVQDPSTLMAVSHLDPQPGETVLDLCAAPGGKTVFIAQLMKNQGRIIAQDTHRARMELIKQNCSRLGVTCVQVSGSTTVTHPELSLQFDRVLVDAPCSNTGVMRRRVDLRWRVSLEEINRLQEVQVGLLDDAAAQVKPGGVLVYSTCSLEPEENESVIRKFLALHNEFRTVQDTHLQPFENGVDGAYVAVLRKRNTPGNQNQG